MRRLAKPLALVLLATSWGSLGAAFADDQTPVPTRQQVESARDAVTSRAGDVAAVRAELALANGRLEQASVEAAQAAEAYNGARYRLAQARSAAREAAAAAAASEQDREQQRQVYADTITASYQLAPELSALHALTRADGVQEVLETTSTVQNTQQALDARYDEYRAAATLAQVSADRAARAREDAEEQAAEAKRLRDAAAEAADAAAAEAAAVAEEKSRLIADLARLEGISVELAQRRQSALEARAAAAAAQAAEQAAAEAAAPEAEQPAPQVEQEAAPADAGTADREPKPEPEPELAPTPEPSSVPAPSGGAHAAIAFARAQLGEPYRWGAAGPGSWDCSGLTMSAWARGGKSLPHYSVAQYEQSTPIPRSQLRPGDLVFWGSSDDPSSIYHVALYVGNDRIIHAPRTGRPVTEESMYYWTPPNFHARP